MTNSSQRFTALDVFRGLTICLMVIVNTPGDEAFSFAPLLHAKWHGFTPTDLVFPSFLFAVGNAMSFVMKKWKEQTTAQVLGRIFKRTAIIFLCGFFMYWFPFVKEVDGQWIAKPFSHTRLLGVLQRIALCYCIASLLVYFFKTRTVVIISIALLLLYWAVSVFFGDAIDPFQMTTNAGYKLDVLLIGENHLYHGEGIAFDPEGLTSTLPAIVNVTAGYFVGLHLQRTNKSYEGLTKLLLAGFALIATAYFWNFIFPINKKLWTSSFVLQTVGLDCLILGTIIFIMDKRPNAKWPRFLRSPEKIHLPFIYFPNYLPMVWKRYMLVKPIRFHGCMNTALFIYLHTGTHCYSQSHLCCCAGDWDIGWIKRRFISGHNISIDAV
jgi:predicted acyltransferase